ncbi:hypothetical protein SEA_STEPHIG9_92 [Mycobacterium phage Stephig9]|uniref:Uncharacterized protein n=1 Tax=Mycobacterium phage Stephig9 TaxID=2591224 RepID=A0A514DHF4_9CAUD|nr:hypothetical protein SEA_STEPHIG9_92 [Mycobacterium phage Stephig9]
MRYRARCCDCTWKHKSVDEISRNIAVHFHRHTTDHKVKA